MYLLWIVILILIFFFGWTALFGAPYLPSKKRQVRAALTELYRLGKNDLLVDLGSGDGMVLREATKNGAMAVGYEINPLLFLISRFLCRNNHRIKISFSNYWNEKLPSETTVVYVFGVGRDMTKLQEFMNSEAKRLKKRIRLISFGFEINGMKKLKSIGACHLYIF